MQLTVQEELGGKMHFLVAKGIKLQSWKDSGFECEGWKYPKNFNIIILQLHVLSFLMPLFSQAYNKSNNMPNLCKMKISSLIILQ